LLAHHVPQAGAFKIGDAAGTLDNIVACKLYRPGSVGFVSKSGGMSNELYNVIARAADGIYEGGSGGCVGCVGLVGECRLCSSLHSIWAALWVDACSKLLSAAAMPACLWHHWRQKQLQPGIVSSRCPPGTTWCTLPPAGIAIGGDAFPGSTLSDHCLRYQHIPQARAGTGT